MITRAILWYNYCEQSESPSEVNGPRVRNIIASEASFLVRSMARNFVIYIYISGRPSFCKCSKCFYVYLNIRPMRYSAMQNINAQRINVTGSMNWHNNVEPPM